MMLTRRTLAALPASLAAAAPAFAAAPASLSRRGVAELPRTMMVGGVPALTYALIEHGRIADAAALGVRKAGGTAVTSDTFFDAASLTKPVFATAVLALADQGVIDLDRPLQAYLPLFDDPLTREITARHVLSHSTGLPNWRFKVADPLKSEFRPGSRWSYSGEAHFALLRVVEHLTGDPLGLLLEKHVFGPAAMTRSTIAWSPAVAADNAWPHGEASIPLDVAASDQGMSMARSPYALTIGAPMERWTTDQILAATKITRDAAVPDNSFPSPAFGLWTTAADYARFLIFAACRKSRAEPVVRMRGNLAWGLGWGLELGPEGPFAWQWGDTSGVKNIFMLHLPSRSGLVAFTNSDSGAAVYRQLVRRTFSREFDAFLWI